jgi:hypothetical protein
MKRLLCYAVACFGLITSANAVQNELVPPTAGIYTGPQYSQKIGDAFRSLAGCNKGPVAPANVGGSTVDGLCWIDDSVTPNIQKRYINGGWAIEGYLDPATSSFVGVVGGGLGSISSSATTDLNSVPQANVSITGTTTISSFGSAAPAGVVKFIRFAGALTLTNSASLAVPGGFDLTTAANDRAVVTHLGSGNWEITQYTRANGIPIDVSAVGKPDFTFSESVPPLHVAAYGQALSRTAYPAYLAKTTRAQNGTRTAGNATITAIANTSGLGAGMPVEQTGVTAGCTIASVTSSSITLNSSSCVTASGTSTVTVFLYGYGAGGTTSTVGVPDCRNRVLAGRDRNDPGSLAGLLTSSYFGQDSGLFGARGGAESQTLTLGQLPTGITSVNASQAISVATGAGLLIPASTLWHTIGAANSGGFVVPYADGGNITFTNLTATGSNSIGVTSNNTSGQSHPIVQPTQIADCVVRVTP